MEYKLNMNVLSVGTRFAVHIEDEFIKKRPLCGKEIDPYFITRVLNPADVRVRCPKCRKMWKEMNDGEN